MTQKVNISNLGNLVANGDFPNKFVTGIGGKMGVFADGTFGAGSIQLQVSKDGAAPWINFGSPITTQSMTVLEFPPCHVKGVLTGATLPDLNLNITRP